MSAREWGPPLQVGDEWEGNGIRLRIASVSLIGIASAILTTEPRGRLLRIYPWGKWSSTDAGGAYPSTVAAFVACYGLRKVR